MPSAPHPPYALAERVGALNATSRTYGERYDEVGAATRRALDELVPDDWDWVGRRILDFGCGAGRTMRHFLTEAARGTEVHGCDIDAESIAWIADHLSPPLRPFVNGEAPPLDRPDDHFDLVYAMSVFTHITDEWAAWLVELHRVLRPGGLLVASILGPGMGPVLTGEPWDDDRVGMNVLRGEQGWDRGGPSVLLSRWWLEAHWGRAFRLLHVDPGGAPGAHGAVVARARADVVPTVEALTALEPDEPRELAALRHNLVQAHADHARTVAHYEGTRSWRAGRAARRIVDRAR